VFTADDKQLINSSKQLKVS